MNRSAKLRCIFCCSFSKFSRYSLAVLMGVVLLSDSVGATFRSTNLQIAQQPVTNSQDAIRAAAQQAFNEGVAFYKQRTAESLKQAMGKWEIALQLWQKVGDKAKQAFTFASIGQVYFDLGEKHKALQYYNSALPLSRAVGNRSEEATILNNIGAVYNALGEKQKALQYYNFALPLLRAIGDRGREAATLNNIGEVYDALGEKQKALQYYNCALPLIRAVGDKGGEAIILFYIASLQRNRGNLEESLKQIEAAISIIENLRTKVLSQDLRTSYFASVQGYYKLYIDLLMQLHNSDLAPIRITLDLVKSSAIKLQLFFDFYRKNRDFRVITVCLIYIKFSWCKM